MRDDRVQDLIHLGVGLSHGQAADGVAVQVHFRDLLRVVDPDIGVDGALVDAEQKLVFVDRLLQAVQTRHLFFAPVQPPGRARHRFLYIISLRVAGWAFVEGHGDGGCQMGLDPHALLGSHKDPRSVDMGVERDALLLDLAKVGQREDLKAARIREDGLVPAHEAVEAAEFVDRLIPWPYVKVIGVAERHLRVDAPQVVRGQAALDGSRRRDVHEDGRLDRPVYGLHAGLLGHPFLFDDLIFHFCHSITAFLCCKSP